MTQRLDSLAHSHSQASSDRTDIVGSLDQMANRMDEIRAQMNSNDKYYERRFDSIEANFDHLSQGLSHLFNMFKDNFPVTKEKIQFFERRGPHSGDDQDPKDGTPGATKDKSVEDNPTKGEKSREMGESSAKKMGESSEPADEARSDKGKQADEAAEGFEGGYDGAADADPETEYAPEPDFSRWTDTKFDEELAKQLASLKEQEVILEKTSKLLDKREKVQRKQRLEKQRIHKLKTDLIKLDAQTKIGPLWDATKEIMSTPQVSPIRVWNTKDIVVNADEVIGSRSMSGHHLSSHRNICRSS
ncbi:hypothetical protein POM88_023004 [Heracleum sosnowskyi]|uniref:Uncharacterized protein n=1 Tax=Heracleum sosnowskyi TaxID=360622 RepID=A0AAD8IG83_9APIA|nr:hypothetical protein POM88_023004 [Heracleum sosnowskyi]